MHPKSPSELYSEAVRLLNEQENSEEGLRYLKEAALRKYCEAENLFAIYLARESEDGLNEARARRFLKQAHKHGSFYGSYNYAMSLAAEGDKRQQDKAIQVFRGLVGEVSRELFRLCVSRNKANTAQGWEMLAKMRDWDSCVSYGKHMLQEWCGDERKTESLKIGIDKLKECRGESSEARHLLGALECMPPSDPLIKALKSLGIEQKQETDSASNRKLQFYKWAVRHLLFRNSGDRAREYPKKGNAEVKKPWWKHKLYYFAGRPPVSVSSDACARDERTHLPVEPTEKPEDQPRGKAQHTGNA